MLDAADLAAFLTDYLADCDEAGVDPLTVRELATLVELIARADGLCDSPVADSRG